MTCPECRTKFTVRTLRKLYLNVLEKDDEVNTDLHKQLVDKTQTLEACQTEKAKLVFENYHKTYALEKATEDLQRYK
jgi:hypothetical protein